jgi:OOP family OmpA-OmpF porin
MKNILLIVSLFTSFFSIAQPKIENGKLIIDKPVVFKAGSSELTDEGKEALQQVKEFLQSKDYITTMRVEGHTDTDGNPEKNQTLTEQRALSVCKWLVANGVDCKRLLPVGFGGTKPVAANDSPDGKAENRRIDFVMAGLRGKAIGGMPLDGGGKVAGDPCAN